MCKRSFVTRFERNIEKAKPETNWHIVRKCHKRTFEAFRQIIDEEIIKNEKIYFLSDLHNRYKMIFLEVNNHSTADDIKAYTTNKLQDKILDVYGNNISIISSTMHGLRKLVFKHGIDINELVYKSVVNLNEEKCKFQNVAYELRNSIKSSKTKKNVGDVDTKDIIEGECHIPELLFNFICDLVQGPDARRKNSDEDFVRIKSLCSDIIFIVTKGRVKPAKQLT